MNGDSIVILGVPVDILDLNESVARLFHMAGAYDRDGRTRTAVVVTAETIMRLRTSYGKKTGKKHGKKEKHGNDHSRLVNTLRHADLMIPAGLPVSWAARILGTRLKKRFSAVNFFKIFLENTLRFGKSAALIQKSTALNDKEKGDADALYEILFLSTAGPAPAAGKTQKTRDTATPGKLPLTSEAAVAREFINEKINEAGIDFLVIDINDPGLAKWFEKSKSRIHVPVILVVSKPAEFLEVGPENLLNDKEANTKDSAALTKRFLHRPFKRLYKNYFILSLMILPLALYQKYNQTLFNLRHQPSMIPSVKSAAPQPACGMLVKIISMPDPLDASVTEDIRARIRKMSQTAPKIVLDFSRVNFIDSSGLGMLMTLYRKSFAKNREIFLTGIKPGVYRFLELTKTIDFFENQIMRNTYDVLENIKKRISGSSFYYLALIRSDTVVFNFYGQLDAAEMVNINTEALMDPLGDKNVILNLEQLEFIDSAGMLLLVKIHRHVLRTDKIIIACGMREPVRRLFTIAGIDGLFAIERDLSSAELALRRRQIRQIHRDHPEAASGRSA